MWYVEMTYPDKIGITIFQMPQGFQSSSGTNKHEISSMYLFSLDAIRIMQELAKVLLCTKHLPFDFASIIHIQKYPQNARCIKIFSSIYS